jgi:hypothetical protein
MDRRIVRICKAGDQLPASSEVSQINYTQRLHKETIQHTLQDVQTDTPQLVNIWVVDLCEKPDLRWSHGIVIWKK